MNRDIVNLRNYFNKLNLRNEISFKNTTIKKIERCKPNLKKQISKYEETENDIFDFSSDYSEDLIVKHDASFKPQIKPQKRSNNGNNKMRQRKDNIDAGVVNKKRKITQDNKLEQNISNEIKCVSNDVDFNYNIKTQNTDDNIRPASNINEHRTDLQSLLIMMAIDSNVDNTEKDDVSLLTYERNDLDVETKNDNQIPTTLKKDNAKISEVLCIIPFRTEAQNRHNFLEKKYLKKWKIYADTKRQIKEREIAINKFFDKLTEKKNSSQHSSESVNKTKLHVRDYNTYQHR